MRDLILKAFRRNWYKSFDSNLSMKFLFALVYKAYALLDAIYDSKDDLVAIHGSKSRHWIVLYLACFIRGVKFVIIPYDMNRNQVLNLINELNVSYLFTEATPVFNEKSNWHFNRHDMMSTIFLKGAYDIKDLIPITLRRAYYNENLAYKALDAFDPSYINKNVLKGLLKNELQDESIVYNVTSGVEHYHSKIVVSTDESIANTVREGKQLMPYNETHRVYSREKYDRSHIVSVLLPFISGCEITEDVDRANIVIETSQTFERVWKYQVEYIFQYKFFNWLLNKRMWNWLFEKHAIKQLKAEYEGIEHVIIYNSTPHQRAFKVAIKALPLSITYGSQETNQLFACNNFEKNSHKQYGCIGDFIGTVTIEKGELFVFSDTLFSGYYNDEGYTKYVTAKYHLPTDMIKGYKTQDRFINSNGAYIRLGRMKASESRGDTLLQLDLMENIIRGLPYIEECMLIPWENDLRIHLLVKINEQYAEVHKMGMGAIQKKLNSFVKTLSSKFKEYIDLDSEVAIAYKDFKKTFDNKIKVCLYRL